MFRRRRKPSDFSAEIAAHIKLESERLREHGLAEEEALAAARRAFGNMTQAQERFYESDRWLWWDQLRQDIRFGLRMLAKSPGFTAVAVLTLALGIGANTAIFSVVNGVMLRPLPFKDSGQLVDVWKYNLKRGVPQDELSYPDFLDLRSQNHAFDDVAAWSERHSIVLKGLGEPERVHGTVGSPNLLALLGVNPELGRTFLVGEDQPGKGNVVVLSHDFWRNKFHSDENIVGRSIVLDDRSCTIVGVMPQGFSFPISAEPVDLWLTVAADGAMASGRGVSIYDVIARLKRGVNVAEASAQLNAIYEHLEQQYPNNHTPGGHARAVPTLSDLVRNSRDALFVLLAAVGMVLLIACVNVANLVLSRGAHRRGEMALRTALGASRLRVVRQLLTESVMLALLGGGLGLAAGYWATQWLISIGPRDIPRLTSVSLDGRVFAFAFAVSLLSSLLFGLLPALRVSKLPLGEALKERSEGASSDGTRSAFRDTLIVAEVALSLVTVLGAGLLMRTLWHLERTPPGFDPHHVLTFSLEEPDAFSDNERVAFLRDLLPRLRTLPGVTSTSAVFPLPFTPGIGITTMFQVEGQPLDRNTSPRADLAAVDRDYFRALRVPLLAGQDLAEVSDAPNKPVALVNETFAKRYFPNQNPIGKRLKPYVETNHTPAQFAEIIGIVGDAKTSTLREAASPLVYVPFAQFPIGTLAVVMRSDNDPRPLMAAVRQEVQALVPGVVVFSGKSLEQQIAVTLGQPRFNALLLCVFAALALALTIVGLYGAISYAVSQRTHEIGIRMALGATPALMRKAILSSGFRLVLCGVVLGLAAALALARVMTSLLFGVSPTDPSTFAGVAMVLMTVALTACYVPARRAMNVDPIVALRHE